MGAIALVQETSGRHTALVNVPRFLQSYHHWRLCHIRPGAWIMTDEGLLFRLGEPALVSGHDDQEAYNVTNLLTGATCALAANTKVVLLCTYERWIIATGLAQAGRDLGEFAAYTAFTLSDALRGRV
jgi:hypothetical protein